MPNSKKKIRCVVIEDERKARETLVKLLTKYCPEVEVVGEAASVTGAVDIIREKKPELVFLDIELIGGTGFDVLEHVTPFDFPVVFTTAYDKYDEVVRRYSKSTVMYKPVGIEDVVNHLKRIIRRS